MTSGYGGGFLSFLVRITTRDLRGDEIIASVAPRRVEKGRRTLGEERKIDHKRPCQSPAWFSLVARENDEAVPNSPRLGLKGDRHGRKEKWPVVEATAPGPAKKNTQQNIRLLQLCSPAAITIIMTTTDGAFFAQFIVYQSTPETHIPCQPSNQPTASKVEVVEDGARARFLENLLPRQPSVARGRRRRHCFRAIAASLLPVVIVQ